MASERGIADQPTAHVAVAVFVGPYHAGEALAALREAGFVSEQVSVVARNLDTRREIVEQAEMGESQDAGADTIVGALTGSVLGGLVGLGALVIPGIGPIVAAGVLASALGGAAVGAAVGGQVGAAEERGIAGANLATVLANQGVAAADARAYEARVHDNAILIAVQPETGDQAAAARHLLAAHGGEEARVYGVEVRRERV